MEGERLQVGGVAETVALGAREVAGGAVPAVLHVEVEGNGAVDGRGAVVGVGPAGEEERMLGGETAEGLAGAGHSRDDDGAKGGAKGGRVEVEGLEGPPWRAPPSRRSAGG